MNSAVFRNLTEPKEENVNQIQLYLHYFKIPQGLLLYVDKDKLGLKEFLVNYDRNKALSLLNGLAGLKKQINSNIVPARISDYPENWQCQYCQFREICDMGEADVMDWEKFKKKIESQNPLRD